MDEITLEKLKALGYAEVPKALAELIAGFKRRIDTLAPRPLSNEALVMCVALYEVFSKLRRHGAEER